MISFDHKSGKKKEIYTNFLKFLFLFLYSDICAGDELVKGQILHIFEPLAESYFELYDKQRKAPILKKLHKEEFFGLRDFYW